MNNFFMIKNINKYKMLVEPITRKIWGVGTCSTHNWPSKLGAPTTQSRKVFFKE